MDGKKTAWGVTEVSQLSKTPARPSVLLSTNDQRPWISASSPGTTAVATLSFSVGFDGGGGGRGVSGAGCSPAKQSSHSGTWTHSLVVPAGWLSLLKARPANYSHRMQSWLPNGEPGDLTLFAPLPGLEVFTGKQELLRSGCFFPPSHPFWQYDTNREGGGILVYFSSNQFV